MFDSAAFSQVAFSSRSWLFADVEEVATGGGFRTLADQLWAESVAQARRQAQQAQQATAEVIQQQIEPAYAVGYWPESNLAQHIFQAKLDALRAAQPIVAAQIAQTMQEDEDAAIIALMMFMDD